MGEEGGDQVGGAAPLAGFLRHPLPPDDADTQPWRFRVADLDVAQHVNNAAYWEPLEEQLAQGDEPVSLDAEIEFREAAQPGEALIRTGPGRVWITAADGRVHASIALGDSVICS